MVLYFRLFVIVALLGIWYNTREAHRHAHEVGCANGVNYMCKFVQP